MWWVLLAAVLLGLILPARAQAPASGCNVSLAQVRLANPLARFAHKLVSEAIDFVLINVCFNA